MMKNRKFRRLFNVGFVLSAFGCAIIVPLCLFTSQSQLTPPDSSGLVTWDGTLDAFPAGAKLNEPQEFIFEGPNGTQTIALPTVTWETAAVD